MSIASIRKSPCPWWGLCHASCLLSPALTSQVVFLPDTKWEKCINYYVDKQGKCQRVDKSETIGKPGRVQSAGQFMVVH